MEFYVLATVLVVVVVVEFYALVIMLIRVVVVKLCTRITVWLVVSAVKWCAHASDRFYVCFVPVEGGNPKNEVDDFSSCSFREFGWSKSMFGFFYLWRKDDMGTYLRVVL